MTLSPTEQRVLGALIEKEITTPENYPLSLNALQAASNQRSSREPVMDLSEDDIRGAIHRLQDLDLVSALRDARVPKWEHRARSLLLLRRDDIAILCLLLLRGPQTPGELRARADRLYAFSDLDAVIGTLNRLAESAPDEVGAAAATGESRAASAARPLVAILPRQPGAREARYTHLLGATVAEPSRRPADDDASADSEAHGRIPPGGSLQPRGGAPVASLEDRLRALESRVAALEHRLATEPASTQQPE